MIRYDRSAVVHSTVNLDAWGDEDEGEGDTKTSVDRDVPLHHHLARRRRPDRRSSSASRAQSRGVVVDVRRSADRRRAHLERPHRTGFGHIAAFAALTFVVQLGGDYAVDTTARGGSSGQGWNNTPPDSRRCFGLSASKFDISGRCSTRVSALSTRPSGNSPTPSRSASSSLVRILSD